MCNFQYKFDDQGITAIHPCFFTKILNRGSNYNNYYNKYIHSHLTREVIEHLKPIIRMIHEQEKKKDDNRYRIKWLFR